MASLQQRTEIRDGMRIDWDVPITMDDGLVLRADVFRPVKDGQYPVILSYGPYAKEPRLPGRLSERVAAHDREASRRHRRIQQPLPELGSGRPGEMGAARLRLRARRFTRRRLLARLHRSFLAARDQGFLRLHRMGGRAALVERQSRPQRNFLLRHQPVARRLDAAAAPRRDVRLGRRRRLVSRHDASWRHSLDVLGELVRHAGQDRAIRRRRSAASAAACTATSCAARKHCRRPNSPRTAPISAPRFAAHPMDDDYHKARSPKWDKVVTPLFSAANWGGQGLHPRGNFEGFVRAASKHKWLEAHGIEHWTHFYTDYGREQQLRFFDHFLHGKKAELGQAAESAAAGAAPATNSCRAPRTNGRSSARAGPSSISIPPR